MFGIGPVEMLILIVMIGVPVAIIAAIVLAVVLFTRKPRGPQD